jgi:hypothetical protein
VRERRVARWKIVFIAVVVIIVLLMGTDIGDLVIR